MSTFGTDFGTVLNPHKLAATYAFMPTPSSLMRTSYWDGPQAGGTKGRLRGEIAVHRDDGNDDAAAALGKTANADEMTSETLLKSDSAKQKQSRFAA